MRRIIIHAVAAGGPSVIALFTFLSGTAGASRSTFPSRPPLRIIYTI